MAKKEKVARKFNLYVANFAYGGNGAFASELPQMREWWTKNALDLYKNEPRIGHIFNKTYADTPITMTRNRAVLDARAAGADFLLMLDSDNEPDLYLGADPEAVAFLPTALDFLIQNYDQGPAFIYAPYGGPPPHPVRGGAENVYAFHVDDSETGDAEGAISIEQYSRAHAAIMRGIQSSVAGPTGCILFDMRAFDVTEPTEEESERWRGWFYYEWKDKYAADKCSTEDVTATRDMALLGVKGYCNWSAWAGHWKPKCVGRPMTVTTDAMSRRFQDAVRIGVHSADRIVELDPARKRKRRKAGA